MKKLLQKTFIADDTALFTTKKQSGQASQI